MRTAFEVDEEEVEEATQPMRPEERLPDREFTLSSATLLAIFFGLVLVCGLCFGFGYTLGRRAPAESGDASGTVQAASPAYDAQPKPSAAQASGSQPGVQPKETPLPDSPQETDSTVVAPEPEPATAEVKPALRTVVPVAEHPLPAVIKPTVQPAAVVSVPATPSATGSALPATFMVQIAAVSNPVDADVLVSALQKHGYSVTVRRESGDSLMHVQVGPFNSRTDAIAMRQKLLADGYNAILK
jgi:cell division septation protein DedD